MVSLKGTNQEFGRPYNRRIVLEAIRLHGPIERAEIARRVGLTVQTVANIIRELEELGFVTGSRAQPKGRGSPATSLRINPRGAYAMGVSVTPLGLEAALLDLSGTIVAEERRSAANPAPEQAFADIRDLARQFSRQLGGRPMLGVGLAIPGPFDVESMSFVGPTTLESWHGIDIAGRLHEVTGLPAFIEADHAAAALGERLNGAGKAFRDFYYLYFGVGLGGCMVHEGLPWRGAHSNAGEIGHMPIVVAGRECPCGNKGCLERYLSLEAYGRRPETTSRTQWIAEVAPLLRNTVVTIENLFDPETIIIGGIAEDELLDDLVRAAHPLPNSISERRNRVAPRLVRSANGKGAVLRGAAALALSGILSPRFGIMFAESERQERDLMFGGRNVA